MDQNKNGAPPDPTMALMQMISGPWLAQAINVAAKLELSDLLKKGPKSAAELAKETKTSADALYRVMRALSQVGVYREVGDQRFELGAFGEKLSKGVPGSVHDM